MHRVYVYPVPKLSLLYILFTYDPIHRSSTYMLYCAQQINGHPLHVLADVRMGDHEGLDAACMQRLPSVQKYIIMASLTKSSDQHVTY